MLNSNTSTTAAQTTDVTWCIWEIKINVPKQVVSTCLFLSHSVVNQQSQHQVPLCLQCHDGSYFSLSQHSSTYTARQTTMLQASISRSPVSANVRQAPLFLHTTKPQVFNYSHLYLTNVANKPRSLTKHSTLQVLMPKFLFLTTTSRHDARLSSTTHCALRASRINYNLTNLSRCNSFLQYFPSMDLCSASCHPAHFLSNSFQCFLVILQALSLSLPKSPNFPVTLQALIAKVTKLLTQPKIQSSHATQLGRFHLFFSRLPLLSGTPSPISTTSLIQHWGQRYFNLAVPRGICLRYAHASHKPASAFRLPNL